MKKLIIILPVIYFLFFSWVYAQEDCEIIDDIYKKYECRINKICKTYKDNKVVFNIKKYKKAEYYKEMELSDVFTISKIEIKPIKKAVSIYKENLNSIYNCAILNTQKNSISSVKQNLKLDKSWAVKKALEPKIKNILNRINILSNKQKCLNIDKKTIFNKLSILKQTTYETCRFSYYGEYLKEYYNDTSKALEDEITKIHEEVWKDPVFTNLEVAKKLSNIQESIDTEINQAYKIFPIAYNAYSKYENNFPIHFLLELLKEDFIIFREKLHKTINPINQVVYKIKDAMSK